MVLKPQLPNSTNQSRKAVLRPELCTFLSVNGPSDSHAAENWWDSQDLKVGQAGLFAQPSQPSWHPVIQADLNSDSILMFRWECHRQRMSLTQLLARLERWQICACHCVEARECRRLSVNWVKSSFRSRSVCYIGRRSEAASAATNLQCLNKRHRVTPSIWIRVYTGASGNESRKWRPALTHSHTHTLHTGMRRVSRTTVTLSPLWALRDAQSVSVFDHGSNVDVHECVIWEPGYVSHITHVNWREMLTIPPWRIDFIICYLRFSTIFVERCKLNLSTRIVDLMIEACSSNEIPLPFPMDFWHKQTKKNANIYVLY